MDPAHINKQIFQALFRGLINKDVLIQRQTIEHAYFQEARLQNPYLVLGNRAEIIRGFAGLSNACTELYAIVDNVDYDPTTQKALIKLTQVIKPKALGGVIAITTHQHLYLQLETDTERGDNLLRIVEHTEKHVAQDVIKQMPIIGKYYEHEIRTAVGQLSMAGASVINATGLLDLVPAAVRVGSDTATAARQKAERIASRTAEVAIPALEATGVTPLVRDLYGLSNRALGWAANTTREAAQMTRSTAAQFLEDGRGDVVDCYSPTCEAGKTCYCPTCPRGKAYRMLSVDTVSKIMRGAYQGLGKSSSSFLKVHPAASGDNPPSTSA
ncbi:uncharacterized protein EV422DRAFT_353699 [Fimicolochytrium jonesii]|uniref:uncharacterized protein n=1 Tax=Fimicolochytrium jonesii TaxID=1396493 RepID=UPI0022FE8EE0|nr:uncharacterized protein EV422DRAFT_353699 [Fimicolochytrium jonesii]KAI8823404.1 hypothetical protein EV422DRAFT_353699 [Fimicolochytrium jonesii]